MSQSTRTTARGRRSPVRRRTPSPASPRTHEAEIVRLLAVLEVHQLGGGVRKTDALEMLADQKRYLRREAPAGLWQRFGALRFAAWRWLSGASVCYAQHFSGVAFCKRRPGHLGPHRTASGFEWEPEHGLATLGEFTGARRR